MKKLVNKPCEQCGKELIQVRQEQKICTECRDINNKKRIDKMNERQSEKTFSKNMNYIKECFDKYITDELSSTPIGFTEKSGISYRSIVKKFRDKSWFDILEMFGKDLFLLNYIKNGYLKWTKETGRVSIQKFADEDKYISYMIIRSYGMRKIIEYCGRKYSKNSEEDYKNNFEFVKNFYGYIPLYGEFKNKSGITMLTYQTFFNLNNKNVYEQIVKMYVNNLEYEDFLKRKIEHKKTLGKLTCIMNKDTLTIDELSAELKQTFDDFYSTYKKYPPMKLFGKIVGRDYRTYERVFGKKFKDICLDLGYDIEDKASAEYIVLHKISKLLSEKPERQKSWNWLIGIKNYPLFVDGYFKKHNLVLEFDGRQHAEPVSNFGGVKSFEILHQNDEVKNKLIPEHGIKLIRISAFDDWYNEYFLKQILIQNNIL